MTATINDVQWVIQPPEGYITLSNGMYHVMHKEEIASGFHATLAAATEAAVNRKITLASISWNNDALAWVSAHSLGSTNSVITPSPNTRYCVPVSEVKLRQMRSPMAELRRRAYLAIGRLQDYTDKGMVSMREDAAATMIALLEVVEKLEPFMPANITGEEEDAD